MCSSDLPHMGPGSVRPAFQPRGRSTGQHSQFTCLVYIYRLITPIKPVPVYSELLSIIVTVVIGTCTVLVGTVVSVPVPPQYLLAYFLPIDMVPI